MAASQEQRYVLYDKIRDEWGARYATAFIEIVPPMDANEIATKQDVENSAVLLRGELAELRGELQAEMADLRGELRGEMADLRGELRAEMGELRGELLRDFGELRGEFQALSRHLTVTMLTGLMAIWLTVVVPQLL